MGTTKTIAKIVGDGNYNTYRNFGNCLKLNPSGDYAIIPKVQNIYDKTALNSDFTFSCFFELNPVCPSSVYLFYWMTKEQDLSTHVNCQIGFNLDLQRVGIQYTKYDSNNNPINTAYSTANFKFTRLNKYHYVIRKNGSNWNFFMDGLYLPLSFVSNSPYSFNPVVNAINGPISIGINYQFPFSIFDTFPMKIADMFITNDILSNADIRRIFNYGSNRDYSKYPAFTPLFHYSFDSAIGSSIPDLSPNAYNLTVHNQPTPNLVPFYP
jgi:hypothetical protein